MVSMRTAGLGMCSTAALLSLAASDEASAAAYLFQSVHTIGEQLAYDNAKPTIADNGSIAFLDIQDYATDERIIVAPAFGDKVVLLDSSGPLRPLNVVGPGISDDGQYVAYMAREDVPGSFPVDRIWRQSAGGSLPVLIAEQPGDSIGAASCRGSCDVTITGSVIFSTLSPTTLSFGDGGPRQTFASGGAIGFHDEFDQSGVGFKLVVLEDYGGSDEQLWAGFGSVQNGVLRETTDGKYSAFSHPNITDGAHVAVIAERDAGGAEIIAFLEDSIPSVPPLTTFASTDGPFASFDDLSLGDGRDMAFLATLDTPGSGKAIYVGSDPVNDRLVGPGDKLFNKTVVAVDLAKSDAVNQNGQIAFAARFGNGTSRIVKASPFTGVFLQATKLLMSTLNTNVSPMLWTETLVPDGTFDLSFNYDLLQPAGSLEVWFGGSLLGTFASEFDGRALIESVSPRSIFGDDIPDRATLEFILKGGPDVSLHLDDIVMPGLLNGSFEDGYLQGWLTDPGREPSGDPRDPDDPGPYDDPVRTGIVTLVRTQPPAVVPLPAGVWLLGGALLGMGFLRRRQG